MLNIVTFDGHSSIFYTVAEIETKRCMHILAYMLYDTTICPLSTANKMFLTFRMFCKTHFNRLIDMKLKGCFISTCTKAVQ